MSSSQWLEETHPLVTRHAPAYSVYRACLSALEYGLTAETLGRILDISRRSLTPRLTRSLARKLAPLTPDTDVLIAHPSPLSVILLPVEKALPLLASIIQSKDTSELWGFSGALSCVTAEAFVNVHGPTLERLLKRDTSAILAVLLPIMKLCAVADWGCFSGKLLPFLIKEASSPSPGVSGDIFTVMISSMKDTDMIKEVLMTLVSESTRKRGLLLVISDLAKCPCVAPIGDSVYSSITDTSVLRHWVVHTFTRPSLDFAARGPLTLDSALLLHRIQVTHGLPESMALPPLTSATGPLRLVLACLHKDPTQVKGVVDSVSVATSVLQSGIASEDMLASVLVHSNPKITRVALHLLDLSSCDSALLLQHVYTRLTHRSTGSYSCLAALVCRIPCTPATLLHTGLILHHELVQRPGVFDTNACDTAVLLPYLVKCPRKESRALLLTLMALPGCTDALLSMALPVLMDTQELACLTPTQLGIYHTPEDEVYVEPTVSSSRKKAKAKETDEEWEKRVTEELKGKNNVLESQQGVRQYVTDLQVEISTMLGILQAVFHAYPGNMALCTGLLPGLYNVALVPLLSGPLSSCMDAMYTSVCSSSLTLPVLLSVRYPELLDTDWAAEVLRTCITCSRCCPVVLLLPVLRQCIESAFSTKALRHAAATQLFSTADNSFECVQLLLYLVRHYITYQRQACQALVALPGSPDPRVHALLTESLVADSVIVRRTALNMLEESPLLTCPPEPVELCALVWMLCHEQAIASDAEVVWDLAELTLTMEALVHILAQPASLSHPALSAAVLVPEFQAPLLAELLSRRVLEPLVPIANALAVSTAEALFRYTLEHLDTPDTAALALATELVHHHGSALMEVMLGQLDPLVSPSSADTSDTVRQGATVLLGTLARYLPAGSPRVLSVLESLVGVLTTPSFVVQRSAADCLPVLVSRVSDADARAQLLHLLLERATTSPSYGDRVGAAMGYAALIQGLGMAAVDFPRMLSAASQSSNKSAKHGALLCWEHLFARLDVLVEPYLPAVLPPLLEAFGDSDALVREATLGCARTLMACLSAYGVRLVLVPLLSALDQPKWRTKHQAVHMLGSMAFCAPKHLSVSLPVIVPRLLAVLKDPHDRVQAATRAALTDIGSVVSNPEIQALVPVLLESLVDPQLTSNALQVLLDTSFSTAVDTPALALLVPLLVRGLAPQQRGTVKRMAAQIIGSMCGVLKDARDLRPYLPTLQQHLTQVLVDPHPDVRCAAARALGQLFAGVDGLSSTGNTDMVALVDDLVALLSADSTSNVQKSGYAQGLVELLGTLGVEYLASRVPELLSLMESSNPSTREGFVLAVSFFPRVLGASSSAEFLARVFPVLLRSLLDDKEPVRATALHSLKAYIDAVGPSHPLQCLDQLLPSLSNASWRVREGAVILVGDLLHRVCGGPVSLLTGDQIAYEEDDSNKPFMAERIEEALGVGLRNRVYSQLYLLQSDSAASVRHACLMVWKSVILNTTRTLSMIIEDFIRLVIQEIVVEDHDDERQQAAGRSLGELVHRTGALVLPVVLPLFLQSLSDPQARIRTGVLVALTRVLEAASKKVVLQYTVAPELNSDATPLINSDATIVSFVLAGLCDTQASVRRAAGLAFGALFQTLGPDAVSLILTPLLPELLASSESRALAGVTETLRVRPTAILRTLIPALLSSPFTEVKSSALASLAPAAGPALLPYVPRILTAYYSGLPDTLDTFLAFVTASSAVVILESLLESITTHTVPVARALGALIPELPVEELRPHLPGLLSTILGLYRSSDPDTIAAGISTLASLVACVPIEELSTQTLVVRKTLAGSTALPGLAVKKALDPVLPLLQHALMYGAPEDRQAAATCLGLLVGHTPTTALRPYVVKVTGPLIRIVGDRFDAPVKCAILCTLDGLLTKAGAFMKPFVPQLQTTFTKALADDHPEVRAAAASGLGHLMPLNLRKLDAVVSDLAGEAGAYPEDVLTALACILESEAGGSVAPELVARLTELAVGPHLSEFPRAAGRLFGACSALVSDPELHTAMARVTGVPMTVGTHCCVQGAIKHAYGRVPLDVVPLLKSAPDDDELRSVAQDTGFMVLLRAPDSALLSRLTEAASDTALPVRLGLAKHLRSLGKKRPTFVTDQLETVAAALLTLSLDTSQPMLRVELDKAVQQVFGVASGRDAVQAQLGRLPPALAKDAATLVAKYLK